MSEVTRDILAQKIREIVKNQPYQKNPSIQNGRFCVYQSPENPEHRCIAGELAHQMGWIVPDSEQLVSVVDV